MFMVVGPLLKLCARRRRKRSGVCERERERERESVAHTSDSKRTTFYKEEE